MCDTWSVNPAAIAGVHGRHTFAEPRPLVASGYGNGWRRLAWGKGLKNNQGSQRGSEAGTISTNHSPKRGNRLILSSTASMASLVHVTPV